MQLSVLFHIRYIHLTNYQYKHFDYCSFNIKKTLTQDNVRKSARYVEQFSDWYMECHEAIGMYSDIKGVHIVCVCIMLHNVCSFAIHIVNSAYSPFDFTPQTTFILNCPLQMCV